MKYKQLSISNLQISLILLFIGIIIILIFQTIGNNIVLSRTKIFKSFYKQEYKKYNENFKKIKIKNFNFYYNIIDKDKPYFYHLAPVLFYERGEIFNKTDSNVIIIDYINLFFKPKKLKKQYLYAFDTFNKLYDIKSNIVLSGMCCCTDLTLYLAHKRNQIVKSIIIEVAIDDYRKVVNDIKSIKWIKFLFRDDFTFDNEFYIPKDILFINYEEEKLCLMKHTFAKVKKLKNDENNLYFISPKVKNPDKKIGPHAHGYKYDDYLDIYKNWIHR